jgi:hypothetical protein
MLEPTQNTHEDHLQQPVSSIRPLKTNDLRMKRTCHGHPIQGGATKGPINLVKKAIFLWHGVPHVRI